ncbi:transposase [Streptomyces sp. NPDC004728]|uniref:transposase n=1 Tax=Streptomyces sp. NPDC004728 TaxID=3154289 RepID=UPI0033B6343B
MLVPEGLNTHVSHTVRELINQREQLTVFLPPAYSPALNTVEWVWAHVELSLANLGGPEALVRNRLKRLQYRPETLDGFIVDTGLTLDTPTSP